ncbi:MAG: hypothetical protein WC859_01435 [Elusimicrobiota bacterium]|jgi:hypothetical protein
MRYWIYWNDLVQGPFELDELVSLHSFSVDLLVCMEGRLEWLPANRIAELAPSIELLKSRSYPPPLPPPPPTQAPAVEPLQGEFFSSPPEQQSLFSDLSHDDSELYSYCPPRMDHGSSADNVFATVTMPIRFVGQLIATGDQVARRLATAPQEAPVIEPVRAPLEIIEAPGVEPVAAPAVEESPAPAIVPEEEPPPLQLSAAPRVEAIAPPVEEEAPLPAELPVQESPQPAAPVEEPPPARPAIPLRVYPEEPAAPAPDVPVPSIPEERPQHAAKERAAIVSAGILTPESTPSRPWQWIPWVVGALVFLSLIGSFSYWMMDHFSSRSAIAEATRQMATVVAPAPVPAPVVQPPVVLVKTPVTRKAAPAPQTSKPKQVAPKQVSPKPAVPKLTAPVVAASPTPAPAATRADLWIGRQMEAISLVMNYPLFNKKRTIGSHAKALLDEMHEKELLHAADTGERLYLPDKLSWSSLREEGSIYRVYLNFSAQRANGERVQTNSYQFRVDLKDHRVMSDDSAARQDFLQAPSPAAHVSNPMANDIESILSAVDLMNKQKLRILIGGKGRSKNERKNRQTAVDTAQAKVQRTLVYFRTRYPEKILQNIARAYLFSALLNAHG